MRNGSCPRCAAAVAFFRADLLLHSNPVFNDRSHFREAEGTPQLSTEQRIRYLRLLAQRLVQEGGEQADAQVASDKMIKDTLNGLRPIPRGTVRRTLSLASWQWQIDADGVASGRWSAPEFDDQPWNHTWVPFVRETRADLWLRTKLTPPAFVRAILQLEQVLDECRIWVNGKMAIHHRGYEPFEIDVTPLLESGIENTIALQIPFKRGEQVGPGGYVRLVFTGRQRILAPFIYTHELQARDGHRADARQVIRCRIENASETPFVGHLAVACALWTGTQPEPTELAELP